VILKLIDGQVHVKLEILGEWYLVPLCDKVIVKCFLASQYGVQPLILLT